MGFAVARAARAAGHAVTLVAGPVALKTPPGVRRVDVVSAREMLAAVRAAVAGADVLVMTAAVADWRPARCAKKKLKKSEMTDMLKLVRNPDILKSVRGPRIRIGFAAETGLPDAEAARKCREKNLDLVVGNDVTRPGSGFGTATNRVSLVTPAVQFEISPVHRSAAIDREYRAQLEATGQTVDAIGPSAALEEGIGKAPGRLLHRSQKKE